jgi:dienelactone hydrolase
MRAEPRRRSRRPGLAGVLALLVGWAATAGGHAAADEILQVSHPNGWAMPVLVRRPPGAGPFPLAIISHGTFSNAEVRREQEQPRFPALASWLLARNYAVAMPQRPGHGPRGGPYLEDYGSCDDPHYVRSGQAVAASISAAADALRARPFVKRGGVLLLGHSAGAWGSLALAGRKDAAVLAVVNFAGGLGGRSYALPNRNCAPARLVQAAAEFGRSSRSPTLWLYAENDSYFGPQLSAQMAAAFREAGGRAEYHLLGAAGPDGHFLVHSNQAVAGWSPIVERFLKRVPR